MGSRSCPSGEGEIIHEMPAVRPLTHTLLQGEAERELLALAESTPNLHVSLTRPAGVYSPSGVKSILPCLPGISMFGISVDELAAFDVDVALCHGPVGTKEKGCGATYDNAEMVKRGRLLLA